MNWKAASSFVRLFSCGKNMRNWEQCEREQGVPFHTTLIFSKQNKIYHVIRVTIVNSTRQKPAVSYIIICMHYFKSSEKKNQNSGRTYIVIHHLNLHF